MFKYIPLDIRDKLPDDSEHYTTRDSYRGAYYKPNVPENFYPSIFENPKRFESFKSQNIKIEYFSVSLFDSLESLKSTISKVKSLNEKVKYVAIGDTLKHYGVATEPNSNGHISYYLYDYESNNPYLEFSLKERDE